MKGGLWAEANEASANLDGGPERSLSRTDLGRGFVEGVRSAMDYAMGQAKAKEIRQRGAAETFVAVSSTLAAYRAGSVAAL